MHLLQRCRVTVPSCMVNSLVNHGPNSPNHTCWFQVLMTELKLKRSNSSFGCKVTAVHRKWRNEGLVALQPLMDACSAHASAKRATHTPLQCSALLSFFS